MTSDTSISGKVFAAHSGSGRGPRTGRRVRAPAFCAVIALAVAACGERGAPPPGDAGRTVTAEVMEVTPERIPETYATTGTLVAEDRIEIASRLMGFIRELGVREGERVQQGDVLMTIDPTEIEAQQAEAEARVEQARAALREAEANLERYSALLERRLVAPNEFAEVELEAQVARQELRAALATLERVSVQLQYAQIRSPVDGLVIARHRQAGDMANPGVPILTLENPETIVLETWIREDHLPHIQPGDTIGVYVDAVDLRTTGTVTRIVPSGDPGTHTYLVKATLDELGAARSGMFARSEFALEPRWGVLVPEGAIVAPGGLPGVHVVDGDGIARFRMVRTGRRIGDRAEVIAGLEGGERIVIAAATPVRTGDRIEDSGSAP